MARLSYWIAVAKNENPCYSIRTKSKKDAVARVEATGADWKEHFHDPKRVEIEYVGAFDLMEMCLSGENRAHWES